MRLVVVKAGEARQDLVRRASYRVQLNQDFTFAQAAEITGYLAELGVSHLYCSPYLQATPGSTHGYDVTDPEHIAGDLGGHKGLSHLASALHEEGLGQILDIVPNHMAADPTENKWWRDVLENGPSSVYARFFDIDWEGGEPRSAFTVLVPILGDHYGRVLEAGEFKVARRGRSFVVTYHDHELPLSPESVAGIEDEDVDALNRDPDRLDELLRRQHYRLAYWRTASEELDYRRFFNIETLVALRMEDQQVFEKTHRLVLQLVECGTVDGLRVDHVDGLRDPQAYLRRLSDATSGVYTVVEKILSPDERLPESWPVAGTTGYDFLTQVNNLFVETDHEEAMSEIYQSFTGETASFGDIAHDAKIQIMRLELAPELERLTSLLSTECEEHRRQRDHTRRELRSALAEVVAHMEVYRTYNRAGSPADGADRNRIQEAVEGARRCREDVDGELLSFIGELAKGEHGNRGAGEFVPRLQQLTAPVMAKGVEDTAFYRYNRLVSLNEVGGDPAMFGLSVDRFHAAMSRAAQTYPATMLTLATHDTKRGADVRARINVLSEIPERWSAAVTAWSSVAERYRGHNGPDPNSEYLLYQTLVGAWPIEPDRIADYLRKVLREAKVHTSWADPDEAYERDCDVFVRRILDDPAFVTLLESFLRENRIVWRGRRNSLAQVALLLTCPGIPDVYQGTELWDLSLVDPDNRRPVDYTLRTDLLRKVHDAAQIDIDNDCVGMSKLRLVHTLLAHRDANPGAYSDSGYEALPADGAPVAAYLRGSVAVVATCRSQATDAVSVELPAGRWDDILSGATLDGGFQSLAPLLEHFPAAVLERAG